MTHDELLELVNSIETSDMCIGFKGDSVKSALFTVIELHKPIKDEWFNVGEIICEECTRDEYTQKYPCQTIQAIEKELS